MMTPAQFQRCVLRLTSLICCALDLTDLLFGYLLEIVFDYDFWKLDLKERCRLRNKRGSGGTLGETLDETCL